MNRLIPLNSGPTLTADLAVYQALTAETINPTIMLDNDVLVDTKAELGSLTDASRITLAGLPNSGVRTIASILSNGAFGTASNFIYRPADVKPVNPFPYLEVRPLTSNPAPAYGQRKVFVQVTAWASIEDGAEVTLRLCEMIKLLLDNNDFAGGNCNFMNGRFYTEIGARYQENTGWYQPLSFAYQVSVSRD